MSRPRGAAAIAAAIVLCSAPGHLLAHKGSDSYLTVRSDGPALAVRWDISLRDLDTALGLDGDEDLALTWAEVQARHEEIAAYALSHLVFRADGALCPPGEVDHRVTRHSDGAYAVLLFTATCPAEPRALQIGYSLFFGLDPQHRGLLFLDHGGRTRAVVLRDSDRSVRSAPGDAGGWRALAAFLTEGVWHIWIGFDHILFLLALLLPAPLRRRAGAWEPHDRLQPVFAEVAVIVTAFTVAHSLTLVCSAAGWISLPSRWVETAIALSVMLAALNNIRPVVTARWSLAFALGLLHGFGFAGVLLELGLPSGDLAISLLGFNLGVELGQLAIVAAFVPLGFWLRRRWLYRRAMLVGGSLAIAALALTWALDRAFS